MSLVKVPVRNKDTKKYPTRYYSSRQEKAVAKSVSGHITKNSGSTKFDKGDVNTDNFLIECKTKEKFSDSISIKKDWLEKISTEALFVGKKYSALAFNFGPDQPIYYIIDERLFLKLIGESNEKET